MSIGLTSAGIKLSYATAEPTDTKPSTGYLAITGLKEIPDMNPTPDTIETTTFDDTVYKTYTQGLKDLGGALSFTFNLTKEFITAWDTTMFAAATVSKTVFWYQIEIPNITKKLYFTGEPAKLGLSGQSVNSLLEITAFIVPTNGPVWD